MVLVYFIRVFFVWDLVFKVEVKIRSPCFLKKVLIWQKYAKKIEFD